MSPVDMSTASAAMQQALPKGLETHVADRIRELILAGELPAGTHLVEAELARQLGVSQGTVRAGIRSLRHEGLVRHERNRGVFVASMTARDAWEVYSLRNNLEGMAARLAAGHIDQDGGARLRAALHMLAECARANDPLGTAKADHDLHSLIVELSGHLRLQSAHQVIHAQTTMFMNLTKGFHEDPEPLIASHAQLVAAIVTGDADEAERLGQTHSTEDGERLRRMLSTADHS